ILDQSPALLIMAPILLPVAKQFGVDPLHYGLIMVFNLCIGLITPPVGMTLFVTSNVAKVKLDVLYREILPFVAIAIVVLLLITFVPQTVLFIPNLL
ncbi:MAG: TRAP transporter large permease subunit, partial [Tepidanaerobacteraceae bacterium]